VRWWDADRGLQPHRRVLPVGAELEPRETGRVWGRRLYDAGRGIPERRRAQPGKGTSERSTGTAGVAGARVLLFVRSACPGCPPAKDAAAKLPVAVELVDADTATGLARAEQLQVFSTPTAILVDAEGREIRRARNAREIAAFSDNRDLAAAASQ
jgi:hypothetical protein